MKMRYPFWEVRFVLSGGRLTKIFCVEMDSKKQQRGRIPSLYMLHN